MRSSCLDTELDLLSHTILEAPISQQWSSEQRKLVLVINNLKRFLLTDGCRLVQWCFSVLLERCSLEKDQDIMSDSITKHLLLFLKDSLSFLEMANNSSFGSLFEMAKDELDNGREIAIYIVCWVAGEMPQFVIPRFNQYLITQLTEIGNPVTMARTTEVMKATTTLGQELWEYLLDQHANIVREKMMDLLDTYLMTISQVDQQRNDGTAMVLENVQGIERYILGYFLALPLISSNLIDVCWSDIFIKLYRENRIGSLLFYEKQCGYSLIRDVSGNLVSVTSIFGDWLSKVAFVSDGIVMKHALDVAIMLDTVVYDPRLDFQHYIPVNGDSILDSILPILNKNDLAPASIDLVDDWLVPVLDPSLQQKLHQPREMHQLKIPLFFLQMTILKDDTLTTALDILTKLMSCLPTITMDLSKTIVSTNRYLLQNIIESVENKWPNFFSDLLEQLFSKAMALNIMYSNHKTSAVEKIFGNLAIISNTQDSTSNGPALSSRGMSAFSSYIASHWRQVMLLFLNHPAKNCRVFGYRVLTNSKFWLQDHLLQESDRLALCKAFSESWFRQLKRRYNDHDNDAGSNIDNDLACTGLIDLQYLLIQCCLHEPTSNTMMNTLLDSILNGDLETFPRAGLGSDSSKMTSFVDRVTSDRSLAESKVGQAASGIPRYAPNIDILTFDRNVKDRIYADNIRLTADIFIQASEKDSQPPTIGRRLLNFIHGKLPTLSSPSQEVYDEALPYKIPCGNDITNGNAFKDHPALFLILNYCLSIDQQSTMTLIRSVVIYFIAFWNMPEVANKPIALHFATQLDETMTLIKWMKPMLPDQIHGISDLLPYLSCSEVGGILHKIIWPCIRHFYDRTFASIPGLLSSSTCSPSVTTDVRLLDQCREQIIDIYQQRRLSLAGSDSWVSALDNAAKIHGFAPESSE